MANINAEHMTTVEEIKDKPVILASIHEHKTKVALNGVDYSFTSMVRPLTTVFWIIFYPLLVW
ncbi:hypothetical protein V9J15_05295 [Candidatus Liberibacter africanus]|uniref:Uncharacterized protein n=1 Tax=Candidatus Liberibacter africanus PTSAPSY TaxID=1277257 RepID=A0A0G3I3Q2_LIBAF|nr:hypothetical protein [Candidatus Liberibacter africanus]AKK20484.1 hypothetical protein G293_04325 [Candidatus Liberibacter africanus PTSAPSY]